MADRKISDLTALTTPATGDLIPIVDVSEAAAADKNKSITVGELLRGAPDGTAAAPGIAFESDGGNGIFLAGTDQVGVATGGVERVEFGASEVVFNDGGANYDFRIEGDTNTALFFVDASADAVGVGTTSPRRHFHIHETATATVGMMLTNGNTGEANDSQGFQFKVGSDSHAEIAQMENSDLRLFTNAQERLRIDSSGRVGIGTSSPASLLHLRSDTPYIRIEDVNDSQSWQIEGRAFFGIYDVTDSAFRFAIDGSGNVGIGTTSPSTALDVRGEVSVAYNSLYGVRFYNEDRTNWSAIGNNIATGDTSANLAFRDSTGEVARMAGGRLLVGTASTSSNAKLLVQGDNVISSPARLYLARRNEATGSGDELGVIHFTGSAHNSAAEIKGNRDGGTWTTGSSHPSRLEFYTTADGASSPTERMRIKKDGNIWTFSDSGAQTFDVLTANAAGTTNTLLRGYYGATSIASAATLSFRVYTNGNVENTNNSYGAISDIKLKENIVDASSQWDDIKALRPVNYNFKEGQTHTQLGLIAQEVELVSPGLVSESPDRDEDGNDLGTTTKSVNYSVLYMKAVKALQEAMERIETLEAKVAALEAN